MIIFFLCKDFTSKLHYIKKKKGTKIFFKFAHIFYIEVHRLGI